MLIEIKKRHMASMLNAIASTATQTYGHTLPTFLTFWSWGASLMVSFGVFMEVRGSEVDKKIVFKY
jgi:hypothetical protein